MRSSMHLLDEPGTIACTHAGHVSRSKSSGSLGYIHGTVQRRGNRIVITAVLVRRARAGDVQQGWRASTRLGLMIAPAQGDGQPAHVLWLSL